MTLPLNAMGAPPPPLDPCELQPATAAAATHDANTSGRARGRGSNVRIVAESLMGCVRLQDPYPTRPFRSDCLFLAPLAQDAPILVRPRSISGAIAFGKGGAVEVAGWLFPWARCGCVEEPSCGSKTGARGSPITTPPSSPWGTRPRRRPSPSCSTFACAGVHGTSSGWFPTSARVAPRRLAPASTRELRYSAPLTKSAPPPATGTAVTDGARMLLGQKTKTPAPTTPTPSVIVLTHAHVRDWLCLSMPSWPSQ